MPRDRVAPPHGLEPEPLVQRPRLTIVVGDDPRPLTPAGRDRGLDEPSADPVPARRRGHVELVDLDARRRLSRRGTASIVKPTGRPSRTAHDERAHPAPHRDPFLRGGERLLDGRIVVVAQVPLDAQGAGVGELHFLDVGDGPEPDPRGPSSRCGRRASPWPRRTAAGGRRRPHPRSRACGDARRAAARRRRARARDRRASRHHPRRGRSSRPSSRAPKGSAAPCRVPTARRSHRPASRPYAATRSRRPCGQSFSSPSPSPPPARRITIMSSSIVISTGR